jgi:hypothetical protein
MANAVKNIAKFIKNNPEDHASVVLRDLSLAVEQKKPFDLSCIYDLDRKAFDLALGLLEEWRFDRHVVTRRLQKYLEQDDE